MKAWLLKLFSGNDTEVSVLHVAFVVVVLAFAIPVVVVSVQVAGYAWAHGWNLLPDLGDTIKKFAEAYGLVTSSTGAAWALQGGGKALANSNNGSH